MYSYAIRSQGDLTINSATVYGAMNGGIAADAGTVVINDVTVSVTGAKSYYTLVTDAGTITVNGGKFVKTGTTGALFGGFNGMPSWSVSGLVALTSNGYTINGGIYTYNGKTYTYEEIVK